MPDILHLMQIICVKERVMQAYSSRQELFYQQMSKAGLRVTKARLSIFDILDASSRPMSIRELVTLVPQAHFVSIYRSIESMYRGGIVKQVPRGFKNLFELGDQFRPHHHHAICEICGKSLEIHDNRLEKVLEDLYVHSGMKPTKHHFELFGVCADCQLVIK
jgi:Fe2+ or Zn2+ uptake regulation protein